jgi:hypothetical protein
MMIRTFERLSDALLSNLVPRLTADAASGCYYEVCHGAGGKDGVRYCCPKTGCGACLV